MPSPFETAMRKNSDKTLTPFSDIPPPQTVKVASLADGLAHYKSIPVAEFSMQENFQWTESVLVPRGVKKAIVSKKIDSGGHYKELRQQMAQYSDQLIICHIDDEVGYGVFLSPDAQPIPKGKVIACYAGAVRLIKNKSQLDISSMAYSININEWKYFQDKNPNALSYGLVDAKDYGNISRFFQYLVSEEELKDSYALFDPIKAEDIATANVDLMPVTDDGAPLSLFVSNRQINPGEPIGFSYGEIYRVSLHSYYDLTIKLFYKKNGHVLGPEFYTAKEVFLKLKNPQGPDLDYLWPKDIYYEYLAAGRALEEVDNNLVYTLSPKEIIQQSQSQLSASDKNFISSIEMFLQLTKEKEYCVLNHHQQFALALFWAYWQFKHSVQYKKDDIEFFKNRLDAFSKILEASLPGFTELSKLFSVAGETAERKKLIIENISSNTRESAIAIFQGLQSFLKDEAFKQQSMQGLKGQCIKLMKDYNAKQQQANSINSSRSAQKTVEKSSNISSASRLFSEKPTAEAQEGLEQSMASLTLKKN